MKKQIFIDKLEGYKRQLQMSEGILVGANLIIEVGAYTIGLNDKRQTVLQVVNYPTQFTNEQAKDIIKGAVFTNKDGNRITPVAVPYKEWYADKIESLEKIINFLTNKQ